MGISRAVCPECGAGLKCPDPDGFAVGERIDCPRCETRFAVRPLSRPRDDDEDDRPRKKKRPRDDEDDDRPRRKTKRRREDERTGYQKYKSSPIRFIILGVLVIVMLVMAFFLYRKWQREKENAVLPTAPHVSQFLS